MSIQSKANILMVIVTMFWGLSYTFMVMGLDALETYNIVALRCIIAFAVAGLIFYKKMLKINKKTCFYAGIQGFLLFIVFSLSLFGLQTTSASNAGFILSLTVVLVPIFVSLLERKLPSRAVSFAIVMTMIGISILTLKESMSFQIGDILVAIAAVCYAIYLILNSKFTKNVDSIAYGVYQLGFAGIFGAIFCLFFEIPQIPTTTSGWIAILGLGIICSAFCFIGQSVVQQYTSPTHTGLIFSLEPIFAAIFALVFLGEVLTMQLLIGGLFILAGNIVAQFEQLHQLRFMRQQAIEEKSY
ncbi:multidrug transporter [[Bacillus] sp. KCTC 13219]|uniref:DMT family transporter n=1 Tax=Metasolibacillus TaxID=2703677 RepID=UPI000798D036|nr:DMT family transporter [Metasolibacillus fluoroglycofenilyticus]KYG92105.1 multidrug transporter [[Bacillus] sp. KCTC 13219]